MNCGGDGFLFGALSVTAFVLVYKLLKWTQSKWELIDIVERDLKSTERDLKMYSSDLTSYKRDVRDVNTRMDVLYNQFYELKKQLTTEVKINENSIS